MDGVSLKSHVTPGLGLSPTTRQGLSQNAIIATKVERNPPVRTSETKKDASLGCFFSINFFFFMKKDHTEFSNKQNAKKIIKQNINKTKQKKKDKNLALLSSRLSEISLCSIEGSGF